jgi:hypothetical protein
LTPAIFGFQLQYYDQNDTIHCGVIPAVNEESYKSYGYQQPEYGYGKGSSVASNSPVAPFGKNRWIALITDEYNVSTATLASIS